MNARASGSVAMAVALLRRGGLVAFSTETVYGLGADATNVAAVARIFDAKGRPATNPLIVHVADAENARRFARHWPPAASELARHFWPGPLTLVLPKSPVIVPQVTAGLETLALRVPDHPLALQLLREFGGPVAAPSANRSSRVSPTTAEHVRRELGNTVDLILDGGPCRVGIESTVLDLTTTPPAILRPGKISRGQIEQIIGRVELPGGNTPVDQAASSPGRQAVHYAPTAAAFRFETEEASHVAGRLRANPQSATAVLVLDGSLALSELECLAPPAQLNLMPAEAESYARRLYAALHEADAKGAAEIFIEMPPPDARWDAVRDRLLRATRPL